MTSLGSHQLAGNVQVNHAVRVVVYCCFSIASDL